MFSRRAVLAGASTLVASRAFAAGAPVSPGTQAGFAEAATLEALPGKRPLIKLSYRPPNFETPTSYFTGPITANEDFFVRYHLADTPQVDPATWAPAIEGGQNPFSIDLATLRQMPSVEIVAVCQCSGNRRGLSDPHVPGVEWAMARWAAPGGRACG